MDKYYGCNVVDSVVTSVQKPKSEKPERKGIYILLRCGAAMLLVGAILFLHFAPFAWLEPVKDTARNVVCYDVFGRDVGDSVFEKNEEEDKE